MAGGTQNLKPFQPGQSGNPSGRPRKLLERPDVTLNARGISPVAEILKLIESGKLRPSDQLKAWLELLSYCHSKPKEFTVDDGSTPLASLTDDELLELVGRKKQQAQMAG